MDCPDTFCLVGSVPTSRDRDRWNSEQRVVQMMTSEAVVVRVALPLPSHPLPSR